MSLEGFLQKKFENLAIGTVKKSHAEFVQKAVASVDVSACERSIAGLKLSGSQCDAMVPSSQGEANPTVPPVASPSTSGTQVVVSSLSNQAAPKVVPAVDVMPRSSHVVSPPTEAHEVVQNSTPQSIPNPKSKLRKPAPTTLKKSVVRRKLSRNFKKDKQEQALPKDPTTPSLSLKKQSLMQDYLLNATRQDQKRNGLS